ncbi:MAG: undecaprenyldiphospho-muramoylpentapeptide beta-N-acetylglucosaminyltransferase [Tissierellia bacterium]|nr:undecaprenyldiphospho-muramoylpentapeptide beta-N-acetylglucosaminyltransferase [Tissierellia bacterium]
MRYILTGGGTGGHIYPALSIAKEILKRDIDAEILYIGTENGLEATIVPKEGIEFASIRVMGLPRRLNRQSFISLKMLIKGLGDARRILKRFKPDIVIGTGGYVSGPMVFEAARKKIPTVIQEQNAFPGITNKLLARKVNLILAAYEESIPKLKRPEKTIITGNPIRNINGDSDKREEKIKLGFDPDKKLVVAMGGSGGQRSINENTLKAMENWVNRGIQVVLITGKRFYKEISELWDGKDQIQEATRVIDYSHNLPSLLSATDVVITSSSAMTLSEVSAMGIPSVLIPKANTAEDHQVFNARAFEEKNAAIMILEGELTEEKLEKAVEKILSDQTEYDKMCSAMRAMGNPGATVAIVDEIEKLLRR